MFPVSWLQVFSVLIFSVCEQIYESHVNHISGVMTLGSLLTEPCKHSWCKIGQKVPPPPESHIVSPWLSLMSGKFGKFSPDDFMRQKQLIKWLSCRFILTYHMFLIFVTSTEHVVFSHANDRKCRGLQKQLHAPLFPRTSPVTFHIITG